MVVESSNEKQSETYSAYYHILPLMECRKQTSVGCRKRRLHIRKKKEIEIISLIRSHLL
jgi:hypothetical protein